MAAASACLEADLEAPRVCCGVDLGVGSEERDLAVWGEEAWVEFMESVYS